MAKSSALLQALWLAHFLQLAGGGAVAGSRGGAAGGGICVKDFECAGVGSRCRRMSP